MMTFVLLPDNVFPLMSLTSSGGILGIKSVTLKEISLQLCGRIMFVFFPFTRFQFFIQKVYLNLQYLIVLSTIRNK